MKLPMIKLPQKLTQTAGKLAYKLSDKKPEGCLVGGIVLGGAALFFAVKDTWDNKELLQEDFAEVKRLKEYDEEEAKKSNLPVLIEKDRELALKLARKKLFFDILKTYWKTAALGGGSVLIIVHGHRLLRKQLIELGTAYAALMESYRQYRANVVADLGAEKDQEYAYGIKTIDTIDEETGEIIKKFERTNKYGAGPYAIWYKEALYDDEGKMIWKNPLYHWNKEYFAAAIKNVQNTLNDRLKAFGKLYMNDALRALGWPETKTGWHVGWVYGGLLNGAPCDDFVDFGVFPDYDNGRLQLPINKAFLDPKSNQRVPLLSFNVVCIDSIYDDIFEYDNRSHSVFEKRANAKPGLQSSTQLLDRFFVTNELEEHRSV